MGERKDNKISGQKKHLLKNRVLRVSKKSTPFRQSISSKAHFIQDFDEQT